METLVDFFYFQKSIDIGMPGLLRISNLFVNGTNGQDETSGFLSLIVAGLSGKRYFRKKYAFSYTTSIVLFLLS